MGYLALYRKYRPSTFDDLVGQTNVSEIIKKEILNNKISHAYLFSGPRGTGKTSSAKIIAKMINCLDLGEDGTPCGKCTNCLNFSNSNDIIEIDAASNNGVDEIRELRDKINLVPSSGKFKIYIIDEVHMLTNQAFNALLKTLEEPPAHIIFILATTEYNKIPVTVSSRCQKFQFSKFTNDDIVKRLKFICNNENINAEDEALYEIAKISDGGLRDAINMLDQLSVYSGEMIKISDVYSLNSLLSYKDLYNILFYIYNKDYDSIINFVNNIDKNGNDIVIFLENLMDLLKDCLINNFSSKKAEYSEKINVINDILSLISIDEIYNLIIKINDFIYKFKNSSSGLILLTSFLFNLSYSVNGSLNNDSKIELEEEKNDNLKKENIVIEENNKSIKENNNIVKEENINVDNNINKNKEESNYIMSSDEKNKIINNSFATASKDLKNDFIDKWKNIDMYLLSDKYKCLIGFINDIEVSVVGIENVIFVTKYSSLLDRLYNNIDSFKEILFEIFNKNYNIVFLDEDEWNKEKSIYVSNIKKGYKYEVIKDLNNSTISKKEAEDSSINDIISIFGDEIVEIK